MTAARRQQVAISVSGLRSQAALLTFGEAIEARFGVGAVRLVRTKGTADVFAATVSDDTDVAAALGDLPGFDILTAIRPSSRDATLMLAEVVAREVPSAP